MRSTALIALLALCGCSPCTTAGCLSGITLFVSGPGGSTVTEFAGSLTVSGQSLSVSCTGSGCVGRLDVPLLSMHPATGHLTLSSPSGTFDSDVPLDWQNVQPNGPGCGPTCTHADVPVTLVQ